MDEKEKGLRYRLVSVLSPLYCEGGNSALSLATRCVRWRHQGSGAELGGGRFRVVMLALEVALHLRGAQDE